MICTIKIDITNLVNYCKTHKHFYATFGFVITKTANEVDAFKYRLKDNKIYYCDELCSNYTQMYDDKTIGYFTMPIIDELHDYIKTFVDIQEKFLKDKTYCIENNLNEIWLSCAPWFSFTGIVPPFNKKVTIPQFIWDKYEKKGDKYYVDLMIMVHHGFADGYHIGKFIELLNENIKLFNYIK